MVTIRIEDVTEDEHRDVLSDLLNGEYIYEAEGERIDADTFKIKISLGEYGVVREEFLDEKRNEVIHSEKYFPHRDIYNALPQPMEIEENDSITVSLADSLLIS